MNEEFNTVLWGVITGLILMAIMKITHFSIRNIRKRKIAALEKRIDNIHHYYIHRQIYMNNLLKVAFATLVILCITVIDVAVMVLYAADGGALFIGIMLIIGLWSICLAASIEALTSIKDMASPEERLTDLEGKLETIHTN